MTVKFGDLFAEWERKKAGGIVKDFRDDYPCLRKYDTEYLFTDCLIKWHQVRDTYKEVGRASPRTYMSRVVKNHLTSLVRRELAEKRQTDYLPDSLDRPLDPDDPDMTLLDRVSDELYEDPQIARKIDLEGSLLKLTPRQRELCRLLEQGQKITAIAEQLGLSRDTIYEEERRIREIFHKAGLREYL